MIAGGATPSRIATAEDWNGAAWVEVADLSTARDHLAGAGTSSSGLAFGGNTGSATGATEEWSQGTTVKTVDTD